MVERYEVQELVDAADADNADELCDPVYSTMGRPGQYRTTGRDDEFIFSFSSIDETNDLVNIKWRVVAGERDETVEQEVPITEDLILLVKNASKH